MNPHEALEDARASGAHLPGPPWILGHRGVPREAPENTLASLGRALELGLDGVEYDLRACADGEVVLLHDADLARTTDGQGRLADTRLAELFGVDAGGWFSRRFRGEPVPHLDEALALAAPGGRRRQWHMIELKEPGLVEPLAGALAERGVGRGARASAGPELLVRVASFRRDVVLEARDAGLPTMLLAVEADRGDLRFARDERLTALGLGPAGWTPEALAWEAGRVERWAWSLDDPEALLRACRAGLDGFNSNEPHRALAARALAQLAPQDDGAYPLEVPRLVVEPEALEEGTRGRGEWYGDWTLELGVRNPFPFPVEVRAGLFVRSGAFEVEGLPRALDLEPGERATLRARLVGGARRPGADPLLACLFRWGTGQPQGDRLQAGGQLLLDAPLVRERVAVADGLARRLVLLRESPAEEPGSVTLRRDRGFLLLSLENPGGLQQPHLVARLGGEVVRGGAGLRLRLPKAFDEEPDGLPFSCGIEGLRQGERHLARWAGGLPEGLGHGAPGRLVPLGRG